MVGWRDARRSPASAAEKAAYGGAVIAAVATVAGAVIQGAPSWLAGSPTAVVPVVLSFVAGGLICGVVLAVVGRARRGPAESFEYDVFVSTPMTTLGEQDYPAYRDEVMRLVRDIEQRCGFTCYYAGRDRLSLADFAAVDLGLRDDLRALRRSRHFLLVLPRLEASSVLVEAGMAIALGKPSVYLKHRSAVLPFILRGATNSTHSDIPKIRMYEYDRFTDIAALVRVNGTALFDDQI